MKTKLLIALVLGILIGGVAEYFLKPRQESEIEKDYRKTQEWVNNPNHYVITWEDGRVDSVYSFEKCPGAPDSCSFTVRIGDWEHMKTVKPTCKYTVKRL